jgi:hypothetical protein
MQDPDLAKQLEIKRAVELNLEGRAKLCERNPSFASTKEQSPAKFGQTTSVTKAARENTVLSQRRSTLQLEQKHHSQSFDKHR